MGSQAQCILKSIENMKVIGILQLVYAEEYFGGNWQLYTRYLCVQYNSLYEL